MSKIMFAYPPIETKKGYPTVGNMRQFQFFKEPTFTCPIVAAQTATMLGKSGHAIMWVDAVAEEMGEVEFGQILIQAAPDYIVFECPTPLIDKYTEIINGIKENLPDIKIILCGDHVSAIPEKVKTQCHADHFVIGGKWQKEVYKLTHAAAWPDDKPLPHIDRNLTRWWLYGYKNGNFKFIPGAYIMSGLDCWHRPGCTFCAWGNYHKEYECRSVEDVLSEIEMLIQMGFKEIFDDSGTFPTGEWLRTFCKEVIKRGYNDYVTFGCNMRFGALEPEDFELLAKAGFRMILWGLESVNQSTLDRLNKKVNVKSIASDLILAKAAGLKSHITVMFGFSWESYEEAKRTHDMVRYWLRKGYAYSAQATICIPYPITPLWKECKEKGWLLTEEWADYDMSMPVMKVPYSDKKLFALQRGIYNIAFHPEFIIRKLLSIRDWEDLKYMMRIARKVYDRFGNFLTTERIKE